MVNTKTKYSCLKQQQQEGKHILFGINVLIKLFILPSVKEKCAVSPVVHISNVSSCQKILSFPVAVNNSFKVGPLVFFL
jgi:hypothetical protein